MSAPRTTAPPAASVTARALELLYGGGPLVLDERMLLRDAVGPLMARAESADFAVAKLRLAAVDLRPRELGGLARCRLLVERLDAVTRGDAQAASRDAVHARLSLLLAFLESGRVEVRVGAGRCWTPDFSLFRRIHRGDDRVVAGVAATGAHFFSKPYPITGPAVTSLTTDGPTLELLGERFEELWAAGYDVAFVLAERMRRLLGPGTPPGVVRERQARPATAPPGAAAAARLALRLRFAREDGHPRAAGSSPPAGGAAGPDARVFDLAAFQEDALRRAESALRRHGGVLLADGVGLGKTFLGLALAEAELRRGGAVVVVAPPSLRKEWLPPLRRLARSAGTRLYAAAGEDAAAGVDAGGTPRLLWLSHGAMSREGAPPRAAGAALVIVDEAHGYRNPATRRYRALALLCRGARVALLTATPINNSLWDLYFQLRLFAGDGEFAAAGVPDLRQAFAAAAEAGTPAPILPVLREVVIRRTRPFLRDHYGAVCFPGSDRPLSLPRRADPEPVRYSLADTFPGGVGALAALLGDLTLAPYRPAAYGGSSGGNGAGDGGVAAELLRFSLLKRLESSAAAFLRSIGALEELYRNFADALAQGRLLRPRERALLAGEQLVLGAVAFDLLPPRLDRDRLAGDAALDLELLRRLRSAAVPVAAGDTKLARLRELIERLDEKVLVFTEFRDTAIEVARSLAGMRLGLVHGGGAWLGGSRVGRRELIERFAPLANHARPPSAAERVDVLIATDVLAEGLNLQDARCVVSYDLPWNPVRLMQRIGRVDRLGSRHAEIRPFHFVPETGLEELLGLMRRIRGKLRVIRRTVPGDVAILDSPGSVERILAGDAAALEAGERAASAAFEVEDRLLQLWRRLDRGTDSTSLASGPPLAAAVNLPGLAADRVLLCFDGPDPAWLVWDAVADAARDDDLAAAAIVAAALESATRDLADPAVIAAAEAAGRLALRKRGRPAAPAARGVIAAASRRILRALAAGRHRPDPGLCARADRLLERLAPGLDAGRELALRQALLEGRQDAPDRLLERIEQALGGSESPSGRSTESFVEAPAASAREPDPWGVRWRLRVAIQARAAASAAATALERSPSA
jgi:superfamily II DNA or RNA helicase